MRKSQVLGPNNKSIEPWLMPIQVLRRFGPGDFGRQFWGFGVFCGGGREIIKNVGKFQLEDYHGNTLPKTNSEFTPETRPSQKKSIFSTTNFQVRTVSFREGIPDSGPFNGPFFGQTPNKWPLRSSSNFQMME